MSSIRILGLSFIATLALAETAAADSSALNVPPTLSAAGEGRRVYLKLNCYGCHGPYARGGGISISLVGFGAIVGTFAQNGFPFYGMPAFSKYLSDTDVTNLTAYVNSLGTTSEPTFFDWWVANPTK